MYINRYQDSRQVDVSGLQVKNKKCTVDVLHHLSMALCNNITPVFSCFKMPTMLTELNVSLLVSGSELIVGVIVVLREEERTFGH